METTETKQKRGRKPVLQNYVSKYIEKNNSRINLSDLDATIAGLNALKATKIPTEVTVPAVVASAN